MNVSLIDILGKVSPSTYSVVAVSIILFAAAALIRSHGVRITMFFLALLLFMFNAFYSAYSNFSPTDGQESYEQIKNSLEIAKRDIEIAREERDQAMNKIAMLTGRDNSSEAITSLKNGYEAILVNYFYLKKCKAASIYDILSITTMMSMELSIYMTDPNAVNNIISDARKKFNSTYEKSECKQDVMQKIIEGQKQYTDIAIQKLQIELDAASPSPDNIYFLSSPLQSISNASSMPEQLNVPAQSGQTSTEQPLSSPTAQ